MDTSDQEQDLVGNTTHTFDQLTIECMANRRLYKQCLKQTNAAKFQETEDAAATVRRFGRAFMEMTERILDDFSTSYDSHRYNTKINAAFVQYLQTCLDYHRLQQWDHGEEDVLFSSEAEYAPLPPAGVFATDGHSEPWGTTAWGKSITKTT